MRRCLLILLATLFSAASCQGSDYDLEIYEIQGTGMRSPFVAESVRVSGIVTATFADEGEWGGIFIQDVVGDGDERTSDGVFLVTENSDFRTPTVGDIVEVVGVVREVDGMTVIDRLVRLSVTGEGELPAPVEVVLPLRHPDDWEAFEGMVVRVSSAREHLTVVDNYALGRGGLFTVAAEREFIFSERNEPDRDAYLEHLDMREATRLVIDDGSLAQNPASIGYAPHSPELTARNTLRVGDLVEPVTGILAYGDSGWDGTLAYRLLPLSEVAILPGNQRPGTPPAVGGELRAAFLNVYNLFNGNGRGAGFPTSRGADDPGELERQYDKLPAALLGLDAHVLALAEIENDPAGPTGAVEQLVLRLNRELGEPRYAHVDSGRLGEDEIRVALLYDTSKLETVGTHRVLTRRTVDHVNYADERFDDRLHRPALAQTFRNLTDGEVFTVVTVHLKSKGVGCVSSADLDQGDGQGNCNAARTNAASALVDWIGLLTVETGDPDVLLIGDLNAYSLEDPLDVLRGGGLVELLPAGAYSFVFDGESGRLDHAFATRELAQQVSGADLWRINADEPRVLDYTKAFKTPRQHGLLFEDDPFRSSDHDPVLIGFELGN